MAPTGQIDSQGIASCTLGLIHGHIRALHQLLERRLAVGEECDADAGRAVDFVAVQIVGPGEFGEYLLANAFGMCSPLEHFSAQILEDDDEFVAAQACYGISLPDASLKTFGHLR